MVAVQVTSRRKFIWLWESVFPHFTWGEEFESLKWLSATYCVKLLGISKFTPAAVYYHIQVLEMCTFLNHWEKEILKQTSAPGAPAVISLNFKDILIDNTFIAVDERKMTASFPLFHWGQWHPATAKATSSFNLLLLSSSISCSSWRLLTGSRR